MATNGARVSLTVVTPEVRLSYPNLIQPKQYQNKGDHFYSVELLVPKEKAGEFVTWQKGAEQPFTKTDINQLVLQVIKAKWPNIDVKAAFATSWPVKDGDKRATQRADEGKNGDAYKGHLVLKAKAKQDYAPRLFFNEQGERAQINRGLSADMMRAAPLFTGGNYAVVELSLCPVETAQGKFVAMYLNAVQFMRQGDRLGGRSLLDMYNTTVSAENPFDPNEVPF